MLNQKKPILPQNICPHLGLKNDPSTSAGYPSLSNICHKAQGKMIPKLSFQSSTCLTHRHETCPIYKALPGAKMMRDIRHRSGLIYNSKFYLYMLLTGILLIIISLGAIFSEQWFPKINDLLIPAWQQTQQTRPFSFLPTETQSTSKSTSTAISTAAEETQPTVTLNNTPTLTNTPFATSEKSGQDTVLELDTPIGNQDKFIIHRAAVGESLGQYASQYNTTIDAIRAVNSNLPPILYIDQILVIPVDIVDVKNFPIFETYQVNINGLTIQQIVEQLSVATDAFRLYNNIPLDYIFDTGEWVLVPRQRP